jgi:nucleotide-binding universal stress UspA family protein
MELGIDLLVMGSVCRTGIAGFLIGNTAEEVINQVDCSVLTLKPKGFITPVTLE